jgi:hypothetical protein
MITAEAPEVYGYTIFCDDIRAEVGGKFTYVGAYSGNMFVQGEFPLTIPKFALGVVYMQRHDKIILPVKFWVFFPGDDEDKPSMQVEAPPEATQQIAIAAAQQKMDYATAYMHFGIANLVIREPGTMKVRAVRGDELIRLGALQILRAPTPEGSTPPPSSV